jgi:integrase
MRVSCDYTRYYTPTPVPTPMSDTRAQKPQKPYPDFPLFAHNNGSWAKKERGKIRCYGPWADPDAALAKYQGSTPAPKVTPSKTPAKRPPGFPLFLHKGSGQYAKKVKGRTVYLGKDRDAALARWNAEKDAIYGGEVRPTAELTVKSMCNQFLYAQEQRIETGDIGRRTWQDYKRQCAWIMEVLGEQTSVIGLQPADFGRLRLAFSKGKPRTKGKGKSNGKGRKNGYSPVTLAGLITHARVVFNWAEENLLEDHRIRYGSQFDKPSRSVQRKARAKRGELMFTGEQIHKLLAIAKPQMKAMIYLGLNCALGNDDCAQLTLDHLDLEGGWCNYARPKTGITRRSPLWPETVEALKAALKARPTPKEKSRLVFITKYGADWGPKTKTGDSPVAKEIAKLIKTLGIEQPGLGFYSLRRTFATIADEQVDRDATRCIGGWGKDENDMLSRYNQRRPSDERLKAVSEHVRQWFKRSNPALAKADGEERSSAA